MLREREEMMHCKIENQNKRQGDTKACECVCVVVKACGRAQVEV